MDQDPDEPMAEPPHKSMSDETKVTGHKSRQSLPNTTIDIEKLAIIFNNPILLSSFVRNFERKDYPMLAQIATWMPGVKVWPQWDPLTQPWPAGQLPFLIGDLAAMCNDVARPPRRLIAKGLPEAEILACEWTDAEIPAAPKLCTSSGKQQGMRLRAGPHPENPLEKVPLEFFECVGYRLKITDLPSITDPLSCVLMIMLYATTVRSNTHMIACFGKVLNAIEKDGADCTFVLADLHNSHAAGHLICSKCARETHMIENMCLWDHTRMIPI